MFKIMSRKKKKRKFMDIVVVMNIPIINMAMFEISILKLKIKKMMLMTTMARIKKVLIGLIRNLITL